MFKKTMLLAMAVGAFAALAAPTMASAQQLTDPSGTPLVKTALFTATSTNLETTTPLGDLTCASVIIHAEVTENKGSSSQAVSKSITTSGCHLKTTPSNVIDPATITNAKASFLIAKKGVGTAIATFEADLYETPEKHAKNEPFAVCHLESTTPQLGITYSVMSPPPDSLHVEGALLGEEPCPTTGNTIHGDFTLETVVGGVSTPITID